MNTALKGYKEGMFKAIESRAVEKGGKDASEDGGGGVGGGLEGKVAQALLDLEHVDTEWTKRMI